MFRNLARVAAGGVLAAVVAAGMAFAQPNVQLDGLVVNGGTLRSYIDTYAVSAPQGLCYENDTRTRPSQAQVTGYACFAQAVKVSDLGSLLSGPHPVTVLAPTDLAFRQLEGDVGIGAFEAWMSDKAAMAAFVRQSIVNGSHTLADLAYNTPTGTALFGSASSTISTISGRSLSLTFGTLGFGTSSTSVDVGPSDAVDGQSYVVGTSVMFGNGSVLIPLGAITQTSLSA